MGKAILGTCLLLLGIYQIHSSTNFFSFIKTQGTSGTSPFVLYALWSMFYVGIGMIIAGIICFFGAFFDFWHII